MSASSVKRSDEFLAIADQFMLGGLVTESSHPVTADLSNIAKQDVRAALDLLFEVDCDVLEKYREFARSGRAHEIANTVRNSVEAGGRMFFTGCGSTGRLSIQLVSIWRDFWQRQADKGIPGAKRYVDRAFPVMAGGDYALIKAVEGFEDYSAFGGKQIGDLGVGEADVVFAITEGGETSFVIGTAWKGVEVGAKVYFVYNNPDEVLVQKVLRSREVIEEPQIEKINLTTGPMAITGSTRMQATTIQLCVMLTVLEMVSRDLMRALVPGDTAALDSSGVPNRFAEGLEQMHAGLRSPDILTGLARLVSLEESVYRTGCKNNYYADALGVDVLTDTTERSPTFCTPPYRKFDDPSAADSWSFLFVPHADTPTAWNKLIKRRPQCVEWTEDEIAGLVDEAEVSRVRDTVARISYGELMKFRIGMDGLAYRKLGEGDCAVGIVHENEIQSLLGSEGFLRTRLQEAESNGAKTALICFGSDIERMEAGFCGTACSLFLPVPVPRTDLLLDGVTRAGAKMLLNAFSTCTMVRLGRVMGNYMIWVVPSNLKLIDRSTRYISRLTDLSYEQSNRLLFEVIEYVEPRMKADQAYPPVVGIAVMRARYGLTNEQAERRLEEENTY